MTTSIPQLERYYSRRSGRMGKEIVEDLKAAGVDGVILTST